MPGLDRVENEDVWALTRVTFLASSLIFLVTIGLGFMNAVTTGAISRWVALTHLHSGTLGWILLSYFGVTIWLFTGHREVSESYARRLRWLVGFAIVAFVGVIASFAYGFAQGGDALLPLGIFAPFAAVMVWAVVVFALTQLRRQPVVTTVHLLIAVGLLTTALGVTIGAWVGVMYAISGEPPFTVDLGIGAHVLTVLDSVAVVAIGIIEWVIRDEDVRWTRWGAVQVGIAALIGFMLPIVVLLVLLGVPEDTAGILILVERVGVVLLTLVFLARVGWRAFRTNPVRGGIRAWMFFGTLWFVVAVASDYVSPALGDPGWMFVFSIHAFFVGMLTNVLLGVLSARTIGVAERYGWAEPAAMWVLNLGIVVFVALEATLEIRHGAIIMGLGVLLGVLTMILRLQGP